MLSVAGRLAVAQPGPDENPADKLPPHICRATWFGERADWSHDGKRVLFLSKTFGDAMEIDLATKVIRNLTAHYPHGGYTRALYLQNGDILLSGPEEFDPRQPGEARVQCWLSVLDRSGTKPAMPLGTKCSEGPAVSRRRLHIAWTHVAAQYPDEMPAGSSRIQEADIAYDDGTPMLANQKLVLDSRELPFTCTLETQNYRPPDERELTFSAYGHQGTDVAGIDLVTKKVVNYSNAPVNTTSLRVFFPAVITHSWSATSRTSWVRGTSICGNSGSTAAALTERLTYFSDYPGYKASNPVVSDDGRFIAFQLAKASEAAGVGHGIFIFDVEKARAAQ